MSSHETLPGHAVGGTCPARRAGSRHWWLQLRRVLASAVEVAPLSSVACYQIVGYPALQHQMGVERNRHG